MCNVQYAMCNVCDRARTACAQGKYGSYGAVDERKVTSSSVVELNLPSGGQQAYKRLAISFAPLTYNQVPPLTI
eukprot:4108347-Prymnesium_polylepis.1